MSYSITSGTTTLSQALSTYSLSMSSSSSSSSSSSYTGIHNNLMLTNNTHNNLYDSQKIQRFPNLLSNSNPDIDINGANTNTTNNENYDNDNDKEKSLLSLEYIFLEYLINEENVRDHLMNRSKVFVYDEAKLRAAAAQVIAQKNSDNSQASSERKRRKACSAEERAMLNRERNRDHAQKTRQRKKVYITKLKELIVTLNQQSVMIKNEFSARGFKINAIHNARKQALHSFIDYRCRGIVSVNDWDKVVTSNIIFTLPVTPYRFYPPHELSKTEKFRRIVTGRDALINDVRSIQVMYGSLLEGTQLWRTSVNMTSFTKVTFNLLEVVCGESTLTCKFSETITFPRQFMTVPITSESCITCRFNSENKIIFAELIFDSMGMYAQLQTFVNGMLAPTVPNTVELATNMKHQQPRAIISANGPKYIMTFCNDSWINESEGHEQKIGSSIFENLNLLHPSNPRLIELLTNCCNGVPGFLTIQCKDAQSSSSSYGNTTENTTKKTFKSVYLKAIPLSSSPNSIIARVNRNNINSFSHILLVQYVMTITMNNFIQDVFDGDQSYLDLEFLF